VEVENRLLQVNSVDGATVSVAEEAKSIPCLSA